MQKCVPLTSKQQILLQLIRHTHTLCANKKKKQEFEAVFDTLTSLIRRVSNRLNELRKLYVVKCAEHAPPNDVDSE